MSDDDVVLEPGISDAEVDEWLKVHGQFTAYEDPAFPGFISYSLWNINEGPERKIGFIVSTSVPSLPQDHDVSRFLARWLMGISKPGAAS